MEGEVKKKGRGQVIQSAEEVSKNQGTDLTEGRGIRQESKKIGRRLPNIGKEMTNGPGRRQQLKIGTEFLD